MKSIIEELYYGNINPCDKQYDQSSEYGKLTNTASKSEEQLVRYFDSNNFDEQEMILKRLINAQGSMAEIAALERFSEGFRLGARFAIEILLSNEDRIFKDI